MLSLRILEVGAQVALATAAIVGALFAWKGWQKEMRGQTEYKLAIDLLTALYRFRDAINFARHPMISAHEMFAEDEDNLDPSDNMQRFKGMTKVYQKRWESVIKAQQTIYGNLQVAEAIWGEEVKNLFQDLFTHGNELLWVIEEYLDSINPSLSELTEKLSKKTNAILHKRNKEDKFNDELQRLITEIEDYLKPKLKSSGWIKALSRKIIGSGRGNSEDKP